MSRTLYFAYGSNLHPPRMVERVPSAAALGVARLADYALRIDKAGTDGSGKANVHPTPGETVWGVVYEIDVAHWPLLDACETGYERLEVGVTLGRAPRTALTYRSVRITRDPIPFDWYKRLMVEGARAHGLPADWLALLEALPDRPLR